MTTPPSYNSSIAPSAPPMGPYGVSKPNITTLFDEYNFSPYVREDFGACADYEIEVIADNSYSMQGERWKKLKEHMNLIVNFGTALDADGIDITFINPQKNKFGKPKTDFHNIISSEQIDGLFEANPEGGTPLSKTLKKVMDKPTQKDKIILIITDGIPRAQNDNEAIFEHTLQTRNSKRNRICILLCMDTSDPNDREVIDWYDHLDEVADNLEVLHIYSQEKEQVLGIQGKDFNYTLNDHIARMFLSPIFPEYDLMDEQKIYMTPDGRMDHQKNRQLIINPGQPSIKHNEHTKTGCSCAIL